MPSISADEPGQFGEHPQHGRSYNSAFSGKRDARADGIIGWHSGAATADRSLGCPILKILIIDNYDSFTFNLFQQITLVNGEEPVVVANDRMSIEEIRTLNPDAIVLSPGPGTPERIDDFGICAAVIEQLNVPMLGVCLGHQGIAHYCGGSVIHAAEPMHGRLSRIRHNGSPLFESIPQDFSVVRYHSLVVDNNLPDCLEPLAWTPDGLLMALRHTDRPLWGIQFHPESVCTEYGEQLIRNFLDLAIAYHASHDRKIAYRRDLIQKHTPDSVRLHKRIDHNDNYKICYRKLDSCFDPERVFTHFYADKDHAFWVGSDLVENALSRFVFMGAADGPLSQVVTYRVKDRSLTVLTAGKVITNTESIFDYLNRELEEKGRPSDDLPFDFNCGFFGYFGYELKAETGGHPAHESALPDAMFMFCDRLIVFDRVEASTYLVAFVTRSETHIAEQWFDGISSGLQDLPASRVSERIFRSEDKLKFRLTRPYETYISDVNQCFHEINDGESYEICLTNQLHTDPVERPLDLYRILRRTNPAPYASYLRCGDFSILSSSPEQFLRIERNGWVTTKPIKGTVARNTNQHIDESARRALGSNDKDSSENLMVVDVLRNDLGRVCQVGTVDVPNLMTVESYETVHHLVSTIRGLLRPGNTAVDCVRAAFPGGSMTGAPKIRTMDIIDRLETEARGVYSGSIGFIGLGGGADLSIVIRTAICTPKSTSIGIGGAIVALSDADDEFRELVLKALALINAMVYAQFGEFGYTHCDIEGIPPELLNSLQTLPSRLIGQTSDADDARQSSQMP